MKISSCKQKCHPFVIQVQNSALKQNGVRDKVIASNIPPFSSGICILLSMFRMWFCRHTSCGFPLRSLFRSSRNRSILQTGFGKDLSSILTSFRTATNFLFWPRTTFILKPAFSQPPRVLVHICLFKIWMETLQLDFDEISWKLVLQIIQKSYHRNRYQPLKSSVCFSICL